MIRWYNKVKKIKDPTNLFANDILNKIDESIDVIYAFFQNCYHLKDWIKNDDNLIISDDFIEDYINKYESLSICADICNGTKHLRLNRTRSDLMRTEGKYLIVSRPVLSSDESDWETSTFIYFLIESASEGVIHLDVFDLATDCIQKWKHFIEVYIEKKEITPVI